MNCADCRRPMVSQDRWWRLDPAERTQLHAEGVRNHQGRGLCHTCYMRIRDRGELADHERCTVPGALILEEWTHADMPREWSKAKRIRHLAPRLGMTEAALEKALLRAGVAA